MFIGRTDVETPNLWHLMQRADSFEKTLMLGKIEGGRRRGQQRIATLNMPANLEISAGATGLEKVSFHSNPKERQCQRMLRLPHIYTHFTH